MQKQGGTWPLKLKKGPKSRASDSVPSYAPKLGGVSLFFSCVGLVLLLILAYLGTLSYVTSQHRFMFVTSDDSHEYKFMRASVVRLCIGLAMGIFGWRSRSGRIGLTMAIIAITVWMDATLMPLKAYH